MRSGSFLSLTRWLLFVIAAWSSLASARVLNDLTTQIEAIFDPLIPHGGDYPLTQTVKVLTPESQLETLCSHPVLSLTGDYQIPMGHKTVIAQCGKQRKFIQTEVLVTGTWWTVTHPVKPGIVILRQDIQPHHGNLEHLPNNTLYDPLEIIGRIPTHLLVPGRPLTTNQLRKHWAVTYGQKVEVVINGLGFRIRISGKALNNAVKRGPLRIKTSTGRILNATAIADGQVIINANE